MKYFSLIFFIFYTSISFSQTKADSIAIENLLTEGKTQQDKLKFPEAYQTFMKALNFAERKGNKTLEFKTKITLANMHIMKGQYDLAKPFFEQNLSITSYPSEIQSFYYHRKAFYFDQVLKLDSALVNAFKGVTIAKKNNLKNDLITLYNEIGYIYERQKKFNLSIVYYDKVLALAKDNLEVYSNTYLNKARGYAIVKKYKESIRMLEDNLKLIDTTDFHRTKMFIYDILAQNYKTLGDSINYYKNLYKNREEILKIQKITSEDNYNDLLLKYQTKEKDELLSKKESERKKLLYILSAICILLLFAIVFVFNIRKKNNTLNTLLTKNNFLLSELNHRIKNNLQLIVSLTTRETNKTESSEITGLTNLASKIESIASLHKQLYLNEELKSVYIKPYVDEIVTTIQPFLHQHDIAIETEIENIEIDSNKSLYIGLIINELLINSIKHAFPNQEDKLISIDIKSNKKQLEITYSDNGIGISNDKKIKLINTLSRQIEADFSIENKNGFYYTAKIKM